MKRLLSNSLIVITSTITVFLVFEMLLRMSPSLISEPVLLDFSKELRREIAIRLDLPVKQARRCIPREERYDKGPELCLAYPDFEWVQRLDEVDRLHGAQEHILLDSNGFCNAGHKARRDHNDIVFIGDSFTWCTSVRTEDTYAAKLEEKTGRTTYNLGFPGIGLYEYLEILQRFGLVYRPRVVVMGIYEGNDLRDGIRYWKAVKQAGTASSSGGAGESEPENAIMRLASAVKDNSYSLNYVSAFFESTAKRLRQEDINFHYRVTAEDDRIDMNPTNADMDEVRNARRLVAGEVDPAVWDKALDEFIKLSVQYGFSPMVVYIPSAYTAYSRSVSFEDPAVGTVVNAQSDRQRQYLAEVTARLGLTFVDLSEDLQQAVSDSPLAYFQANVHLTATGHALIAKALAPLLSRSTDTHGLPAD